MIRGKYLSFLFFRIEEDFRNYINYKYRGRFLKYSCRIYGMMFNIEVIKDRVYFLMNIVFFVKECWLR